MRAVVHIDMLSSAFSGYNQVDLAGKPGDLSEA
jgi:hypothetical protein